MKKILTALLIAGLLALSPIAYAGVDNRNIIAETQLDDDPTSVTGTWRIADYERVAFFVKYDETEVGNSISIAIGLTYSYDGTNFVTGYFYDFAGGSTLQTSETLTGDGWYYCWIDPDWQIEQVKMTITATNSDSDDLATVTAYLVGLK